MRIYSFEPLIETLYWSGIRDSNLRGVDEYLVVNDLEGSSGTNEPPPGAGAASPASTTRVIVAECQSHAPGIRATISVIGSTLECYS